MKKIILIILLATFSYCSYGKETLFDLPKIEKDAEIKADKLFDDGLYKESFSIYLSLAKLGDKYSQYMVSMQYLNGLGVEKDKIQAYGWANLARRSKTKELKEYYEHLKKQITPEDKQQAEKVRREISNKYSNLAVAMRIKEMIRNTMPQCVGSRIKGNCSFVKHHYCIDGGRLKSYQDCLKKVSLMKPKFIRGMKEDLASTNKFIQQELEHGGTVIIKEMGEIEEVDEKEQ